ncbi:carboxylesterase/lipase family protein [Nocardioides mangrovi]|uniref:Carboxylic ester hydrolase n=1 Tax=Nocardioides mangrovi TaxID=2874580 RepID=A0ABS7UFD2_9ACTN|nr:carboxylesterase family protein [Nocardioides mangrovi]MBZ5739535.1 carboxylesterase family protein [Nocardioides mangrovi]
MSTDQVRTRVASGALLGASAGGVAAFRGIPYAAPPVGPLRWRPPAPPAAWDGDRPALQPGPAPVQPQPPRNSIMWHTNFADSRALVMSEDCLYLNVWSPDPGGGGLPVLVFLQGGGNRFGHGGQEIHDGASMARRGVVVVTLTLRVGALGYLAHPELAAEDEHGASGNYGPLDVLAALRWVRENIAAFGGDPDRVTLAGNSAGAAIVNHLMAAPAARGLFRAALGQSSAGIHRGEGAMATQEEAQQEGVRALGPLGAVPLEQLRRLPPVSLLLDAHLGVVLDGRLLTTDTTEVFEAGHQAAVPLLVGWNSDEGALYTPAGAADALRERVTSGPHARVLAPHYPVGPAEIAASARAFTSETRFGGPVWRWARTHVDTSGAPTWVYRFDHAPPLPPDLDLAPPPDGGTGYGVFHTAELPYTGDNLDCRRWPWTEADRELARVTADTWARFVTDLDPNGGALPAWPGFDTTPEARALVLGTRLRVEPVPRVAALEALATLPRPL